ncbi:tyrosine-type recombinase/integrase [Streptomyces pharetrae]|uniref:tyrosine-type recombinase/integrase n=1 Tax=Streptomyces pharetrae TaxID=291370 RepID=UPI0036A67871
MHGGLGAFACLDKLSDVRQSPARGVATPSDLLDPVGFSRTFDRLVKRAGVRRITVRLARHTCGTLLAFLKVHPKVAQAILRHSQISMTMDVYTHVVGDSEREAVGMLAELLEDSLIG